MVQIEIICKKSFLLFAKRSILGLLLLVALYPAGTLGWVDLLQCLKAPALPLELVQVDLVGDGHMEGGPFEWVHCLKVVGLLIGVGLEGVDLFVEEVRDGLEVGVGPRKHEGGGVALNAHSEHVHIHAHRKASIVIILIIITHEQLSYLHLAHATRAVKPHHREVVQHGVLPYHPLQVLGQVQEVPVVHLRIIVPN